MSVKREANARTERLEARITPEQKILFQYAAQLSGKTLTDFAIGALQEAAKGVVQDHGVINLSMEDQAMFIDAIFNPPEPNKTLITAFKQYKKALK